MITDEEVGQDARRRRSKGALLGRLGSPWHGDELGRVLGCQARRGGQRARRKAQVKEMGAMVRVARAGGVDDNERAHGRRVASLAAAAFFPGAAAFGDGLAAASFLFLPAGGRFADLAGLAGVPDFCSVGRSPPPVALRLDRRSPDFVAAGLVRAMVACGDVGGAGEQMNDGCGRFYGMSEVAILWCWGW